MINLVGSNEMSNSLLITVDSRNDKVLYIDFIVVMDF